MPSEAPSSPAVERRLDAAPLGQPCLVQQVHADPAVPERARQLEEIGFFPGGDPLVVRIGQSTFALRGAEAACVQVQPLGGAA